MNSESNWFEQFRENYIENYIKLVIYAYKIIDKNSKIKVKKEEERRTELVNNMRKYKYQFHITFPITYESGVDTKRMDICCYLDGLNEDKYICFECKRFLKTTTTKSNFQDQYYKQGIHRFEENEYSSEMVQAGMIAFLESGDINKLYNIFNSELKNYSIPKSIKEYSEKFDYDYVFKSEHLRKENDNIFLYHILMNFS